MANNVVSHGEPSDNNTSLEGDFVPTTASPYVGTWERNDSYINVMHTMSCDTTGAIFFDFYDIDGTTPTAGTTPTSTFPTAGFEYGNPPFNEFHQAVKGPRWFRVRFVPDDDAATTFRSNTYFVKDAIANIPLSQRVQSDQDAIMTRTFLSGFDANGQSRDVDVNDRNQLKVDIGTTSATFGDLIASSRTDQLSVNFSETTPDILVDTVVTGTGTVSNAAAQSVVASGTTASSTAKMETRRTTFYTPSHEVYSYFTATFSTPTANGEQFIGLWDDDNGFAIGYAGTDFCVRRINAGTPDDTVLADFNGGLGNEFKRDGEVETLNPQLGNVYRIRFGWLGNAPIRFEVLSPDGVWVLMHAIKHPNSSVLAHITNPDLPLRSYVENGGDAVNVSIATSSWAAGVVRVPAGTNVVFQRTSVKDGTLPTGGAPTIDLVFNSEANVLDSGWVRSIDYPGGNFINVVANQSLNVFLMNASDDQGSNITGNTAPTIQTTANVPATLQAPYFDDYYRVLISNESGATLTDYSIYNRGHAEAQQGLVLGLEQTLLGFFSASLGRNTIVAKNDAGVYSNITQSDNGGLRTSIKEHEVTTPITPGDGWQTTAVTTTTTWAVILSAGAALTKRISVEVFNADGTKDLRIAPTTARGIAGQYRTIKPETGLTIELDPGAEIAGAASTGTVRAEFVEVSDNSV